MCLTSPCTSQSSGTTWTEQQPDQQQTTELELGAKVWGWGESRGGRTPAAGDQTGTSHRSWSGAGSSQVPRISTAGPDQHSRNRRGSPGQLSASGRAQQEPAAGAAHPGQQNTSRTPQSATAAHRRDGIRNTSHPAPASAERQNQPIAN
ncbi:hypothetical protein NDU88_005603 [Pleurodeles waltl]|uniref:Uncharacterized protein n=1 Tax=Pleurodeles waltl TaxID=8319 RepID=A0AAV7UKH9_PLEWA|nr:hypothetical protein NDU88_005603 [Pleurodeles waltl]